MADSSVALSVVGGATASSISLSKGKGERHSESTGRVGSKAKRLVADSCRSQASLTLPGLTVDFGLPMDALYNTESGARAVIWRCNIGTD